MYSLFQESVNDMDSITKVPKVLKICRLRALVSRSLNILEAYDNKRDLKEVASTSLRLVFMWKVSESGDDSIKSFNNLSNHFHSMSCVNTNLFKTLI